MKTGLELVKELCRVYNLIDCEFCTTVLRDVLKYGGKDLRSAPLVRKVLKSMENKRRDDILRALDITKDKYNSIGSDEFLHPNYFITVIKNVKTKDDNINLNWGNSI